MGAATYTQGDSQFRNDNGTIATATYIGALNSDQSIDIDTVFRFRSVVQVSGMGSGSRNYTVFAQKNGAGGFTQVTAARTDGIQLADDANSIADDSDITSADATIGSGTYTTTGIEAGYCDGTTDDDTGSVDINAGEEAEVEFCLQMQSPAVDTDYWDLRIYRGTTALDTYPGADMTVTAVGAVPDDMLPWDFKRRRFDALLVR